MPARECQDGSSPARCPLERWGTLGNAAGCGKASGGEGRSPQGQQELRLEGSPARPHDLLLTRTKCLSPWRRGGWLFVGCNLSAGEWLTRTVEATAQLAEVLARHFQGFL